MNVGRTFHILVYVMAMLVFSISINTFAQQNSELFEAVITAEQDADAAVNQGLWWSYGSCLLGAIIATAEPKLSQVSAARLVGKSPEYVEVYTQVYKAKVKNLRLSAAVPGCLTTVLAPIMIYLFIEMVD